MNGTGTSQFIQVLRLGADLSHSFVRFDLSGIFEGSTILSANLSLYQVAYAYLGVTEELNVTAYGTAVGWDEHLLSADIWNRDNRDHPVTGVTQPTNNGTTGTRVQWNVTPLADSWVQLILPNHGFRLGWSSGHGTTNFGSREALNTSWRPLLEVRYLPVVPSDPSDHPLAPFIVQLGVPVSLFLAGVGMVILILVYFGIYAAHNPELVGRRKRQRPSFRDFWRRR